MALARSTRPAQRGEPVVPGQVGPEHRRLLVVLPVELHAGPRGRIGHVQPGHVISELVAHLVLQLRARQPAQDERHPASGLHGGLRARIHQFGNQWNPPAPPRPGVASC